MVREFIQKALILPELISKQTFNSASPGAGAEFDRLEYLSAILAVKVSGFGGNPDAAVLVLAVEHSDDGSAGSFEPVSDPLVGADNATKQMRDAQNKLVSTKIYAPIDGDGVVNIDMDLLGCKQYVSVVPSVEFTGGTSPTFDAVFALGLGDKDREPV